jgi:hypothetical protein
MAPTTLLLVTAFRHIINESNIDAAFERFSAMTDGSVDYAAFSDAVATCLRQGLIREPVRLPAGALQCHWHLELTPAGVEVARRLS